MPEGIGAAIGGILVLAVLALLVAVIIAKPWIPIIGGVVLVGLILAARSFRRARNRV